MTAGRYVPRRGDFVWFDFDPRLGHEQAGRRPALVLSPEAYNRASRRILVCPVTSQVKGYPFEARITDASHVRGVVLADQVQNVEWTRGRVDFIEESNSELMNDVRAKLRTLTEYC
jgi:mRNA interferase MazF